MFIDQPYSNAESYQVELNGTPTFIGEHFHWATHLIDQANIQGKYEGFASARNFPIEGTKLSDVCLQSFSFCRSLYENILFPINSPKLAYHDLNHGLITSITAQKLFLGGLVSESESQKFILPPADKLIALHHLFSLISCFHEIDDWWNLPYPNSPLKQNPYIEKAKAAIAQHLAKLGLSTHDFNRLLMVDVFREEQEISLQKSFDLKKREGFLPDNNFPSLLDQFSDNDRNVIFKVASGALCASDFLQVINPAYLQPVNLMLDEGRSVEGFAGPYVLAWEMQHWRKNALKPVGFGLPDGTVFWDKINLSSEFFRKTALPKIKTGLNFLKSFSLEEFYNAQKVLENKEDFFRKREKARQA